MAPTHSSVTLRSRASGKAATVRERRPVFLPKISRLIPVGEKHPLANPGKIPAFLIEVQSGPYLDEDDMIRFEDLYRPSSTE